MASMNLKSAHCTVLENVMYVCSLILRILRQTLLGLTIPIKYDVLNVLHDGIGPWYSLLIGDILSKSACVTGEWPSQAIPGDLMQALLIHNLYI
jgi:predicted membrane protein